MAQSLWVNTCCNPFDKPNHSTKRRNLRSVTEKMCEKVPSICMGAKICDDCRKKVAKIRLPPANSISDTELQSDAYIDPPTSLASLNQYLAEIGETPIDKSKIQHSSAEYSKQKIERISTAVKKEVTSNAMLYDEDDGEMLAQLKEKFHSSTEKSEKVQILTVLPRSWSIRRIQSEFGASNYMVRKAKHLVKVKGIMSTPNPKSGNPLPSHVADLVAEFYESDEVSRMMPGKKDFVSVRKGGQRVHMQKRLILSNLKEAYQLFKDRFSNESIGFSKFAELRPKHCVLAGASGTHSVCVCTIHQNVKLMITGANMPELTSYQHCLAQIICNPPLPECYLGSCSCCPGIAKLTDYLMKIMDENLIDNIIYKQWVSVDRCTLETISMSADDFIDTFCDKIQLLLPHSFIASQQASFFNECKAFLKKDELLVTADFSKNYSFLIQDEVQGFHWNNSQATIHPFVVYYKDMEKLCHLSFVIISECLHHNTIAFYLFQKCLIDYLKAHLASQPQKIYYFSDGAASQYKNRKNFINLCCHKEDFGVNAQWHFSATSHGKGACDGLGGTVKRLAARASLQKPYDQQIMTPRQLFEWACDNIPAVDFQYCSTKDYERERIFLEERFQKARTIPGTRKFHSFIPVSKDKMRVRYFSFSSEFKEINVALGENELTLEEISGFVTCSYDAVQWWLACVLELDMDNDVVKVALLHPNGPSSSFKYPNKQHILTLSTASLLTKVDPRSNRSGHIYTLTKKESTSATEKLKNMK